MFFFLMLIMSVAALIVWALLLGIGWRTMLAMESLAHTQKEVVAEMRNHPEPVRQETEPIVVPSS